MVLVFVVERFVPQDILAVMRLSSTTLSERYPAEFFLQLARTHGKYFRIAREIETGRIIGFIVANREPGLKANILMFGVDPEFQSRGVGRALLRDIQRGLVVENVRSLDLEVRSDNLRAIDFYQRHGFSVARFEESVYKDGSDALRMTKPLM